MSTPPETFSARFLPKTFEAVFQHLLGWLPDGWAWRAKVISQGGERVGVPPTGDSFVVFQARTSGLKYAAGQLFRHARTGALFQAADGGTITLNTTIVAAVAELRLDPDRSGWAIATVNSFPSDTADFVAQFRLGTFAGSPPAGWEPKLTGEVLFTGAVVLTEYVDNPLGNEFRYELLVPAPLAPVDGLSFQIQWAFINLLQRLRAIEVGAAQNLAPNEALELVTTDQALLADFIMCSVANHDPAYNANGNGFEGGSDPDETLLRLICRAFSHALARAHELIVVWMEELPGLEPQDVAAGSLMPRIYGMRQTLEQWEHYLKIPGDGCFPGPAEPDRDVRRRHVIVKMASLGVQTAQDFVDLARILGTTILCQAGKDSALYPSSLSEADARQTVVFTFFLPELLAFAYDFEDRGGPPADGLLFTDNTVDILQCLFEKLIPSTCQAKYLYVPT